METPITNKIQQILENGGEYEQSRSTGIIIKSAINFIDAAYDGIEEAPPKGKGNKDDDSGIVQKRGDSPLNDIP